MYRMFSVKIVVLIFVLSAFVVGCGGGGLNNSNGELIGVTSPIHIKPEIPFGMTFIPPGAFVIGNTSYDMSNKMESSPKTVSMSSFFMDEAEMSNNKYRQFCEWIKEDIVRSTLAIKAQEMIDDGATVPESGDPSILDYAFMEEDTSSSYYKFMIEKYGSLNPNSPTGGRRLNMEIPVIWNVEFYPDLEYTEIMESLYTPMEKRIRGARSFDVDKMVYKYFKKANGLEEQEVKVYPDTTVWIRDFSYSYNEPMHNDYYSHTAFVEYPVVGVNWEQASAFANWRTEYKNTANKNNSIPEVRDFYIPTEFQWEYAARGGIEGGMYPWGGPYTIDDRGCVLANFKPLRGNYLVDGALYTVEAKSFNPNGYGLYNMAGNVSEWTSTSYRDDVFNFISSVNPNYEDDKIDKKTLKGGSWKDMSFFLQVFVREYEYKDTSRSYIGFRCIQDFQGSERDILR